MIRIVNVRIDSPFKYSGVVGGLARRQGGGLGELNIKEGWDMLFPQHLRVSKYNL